MKSKFTISKRNFLTFITCCLFALTINAQTSPVVVSTVPAHNATNVNVNGLITVTFDQPIQAGVVGKKLTIWFADTETILNGYSIGSLTISGNTLTLDRPPLPFNTNFYISIENGFVKNSSEQYNATYGYSSSWLFTTENDTYSPTLTAMSPPDNSVGVYESSNILSYSFDENVQAGSGNVIVKRVDNDAVVLNVDVTNPSNVIVSGSTLTIVSASSTFDYSTEYYVEFPSGVIEDLLGNPFEGIGVSPLADQNFTMRDEPADTFPPTVISFSPADNATGVDVNTDFAITFNEDVQIGTGSIFVKRSSNGATVYEIDVSTVSISGSLAIFTLPDNLYILTNYYIWVDAGAFTDLAGNDYAGTSTQFVWNFTTATASDYNPPIATALVPADNATNAIIVDDLILEFSENVQLLNDAVLKNYDTNAVIPSSSSVSGSTITINPTSNLALNTSYYVEIAYGAIRDLAGNSFAGYSGNSDWNFTTELVSDTTAPVVTLFTPANNATDISVDISPTLTFDEPVQLTGSAVLRDYNTNAIIPSTSLLTAANVLTVSPTPSFLDYSTRYYITLEDGVIQDLVGNNFSGFSTNTTWNFTTEMTPLVATVYTPVNNATNVSTTNNLTLEFNRDIVLILPNNVRIKNWDTNSEIPSTSSVSGNVLTINPTSDLDSNTRYYVIISILTGTIEDLFGNEFFGIGDRNTWNFTTETGPDTTPPTAVTFTPADNTTDVGIATNLTIAFDEAIQLTGSAVLKDFAGATIPSTSTASGNTLTINPTSDLANNTQYYIRIANGVVQDIAGNSYAGFNDNSTWNFTTESGDSTPPVATLFSPLDDGTDVSLTNNFVIFFDEDIQISGGGAILRDFITNVEIASSSTISIDRLVINPSSDLTENTQYYIELASGVVQDLAGNDYAGFSGNAFWNFTTIALDTTPPTAVTFTPADNATDVSIATNLTLDFDEAIQLTGSAVLKDFGGATIPSTSTVSGNTLIINPTLDLDRNTPFYVEIATGIIKDLAGNDFAGFSGNGTWSFTTGFNNQTFWNGTSWDNGNPNNTIWAVIDADYITSDVGSGNIDALLLNVNLGVKLAVSATDLVSVVGDIIVDGTLEILDGGILVQIDDLATVTNNGSIRVEKITSVFSDKDFTFMSSPMSSEARDKVYSNAVMVRHHETANFTPHPDVEADFPLAENFADDNGDNWITHTGLLNVGEGYFVKPFAIGDAGGNYTTIYEQGTLNNGVVNFTAVYGDDQNDSPNILGNPYASAIDAFVFIDNNAIVDAIYYWEHLTDPNTGYPGYSNYNYDMGDISMYNLSGGIAAANAGGGAQTNNRFIASGQGFAIKANAAGTVTFNNAMRLTYKNNNYRNNESIDRLYLKISNDTYSLKSATLIAFTDFATNDFDSNYDSKRLATPVSLFSLNSDRELGIQGRSIFNEDQIIPLGFSTQVEENQEYTISISSLEGELLSQATIYLKDNLLNTITNLSETDYSFISNHGSQTNRFVIVFTNDLLGTNEVSVESISIYPNPTQNILNINSSLAEITSIEIYDLRGRKVGVTNIDYKHSYQLDMSGLKSAVYFVKINTNKGTITKRIIKE